MGKSERDKGARFERAVASKLSELFNIPLCRGNQKMGAYQPDVVCPIYWVECTHGKAPRIGSKITQSLKDLTRCDPEHRDKIPLVIHKKDHQKVWVTMPYTHFEELIRNTNTQREQLPMGASGAYSDPTKKI